MGKSSGFVLILAGVSIAAYTLSAQRDASKAPPVSAPATLAVVENAAQPPTPPAASVPAAAKQLADNNTPTPGADAAPPRVQRAPDAAPPSATLAPSPAPPQKLRPGALATVRVAETPPRLPVGESAAMASPPLDRPALTREIQRQLKRIGCYQGDISGVWSPSVRQGVKSVTDRVNASLPIDGPDPVLLAMVQRQEPGACGGSCPKGQDRAADGRCLPAALVANAAKHRTPPTQAQTGRATKSAPIAASAAAPAIAGEASAPPPAIEGRMSLAGPDAGSNLGTIPNLPRQAKARSQRQRARVMPGTQRAMAYRSPSHRQRSAQRFGGMPFWTFPFFTQ